MIKLLLFFLLCSLGYQLARSLRRPRDMGSRDRDGNHIDPSRAVEAQFEAVDVSDEGDSTL